MFTILMSAAAAVLVVAFSAVLVYFGIELIRDGSEPVIGVLLLVMSGALAVICITIILGSIGVIQMPTA